MKIQYILSVILLALGVYACADETTTPAACDCTEMELMIQERDQFIGDLSDNLGGLNTMLDSISVFQNLVDTSLFVSTSERDSMVTYLELLLHSTEQKIAQLEDELGNAQHNEEQLVIIQRTLNLYREQLAAKEEEVEELKSLIAVKDTALWAAAREIEGFQYELTIRDSSLADLDDKNLQLTGQVDSLSQEVDAADVRMDSLRLAQEAQRHFELGEVYFDELDGIKSKTYLSRVKKEHRIQTAHRAQAHFQRARQLGIIEADRYLNILIRDPKYNKFLGVRNPIKQ